MTTPLEYFATLVAEPSGAWGTAGASGASGASGAALAGEGAAERKSDLPLTEAAISIAQDVYPRLDLGGVQSDIDRLAATLKARLPSDASTVHRLRSLNHYFFKELGFQGNRNDYYDPDNTYLNKVLERRRGIPISLAIVYMEIGEQIGLRLRGVSFPGHFLVKLSVRSGDIFLDPFTGASLSREELEERLAQYFEARKLEVPTELALIPAIQEAAPRDILVRMLRNLKGIYHDRREFERLLAVQQRLVILRPESGEEKRDRGLIYAQLDCPRAALEDLSDYLTRHPDAPEAEEIRRTIAVLRAANDKLN